MSETNQMSQIKSLYLAIFCISFIFVVLCFVIPLCEPSGTINQGMFAVEWEGDDSQISQWVSKILYDFGDVMCHQRPERSWFVNGNQLPLCIRCMAISFGMVFIFGIAWRIAPFDTFSGTLGRLFGLSEMNHQKWGFVLFLLCLLAFPMVIDGFGQILFPYESNAYMRLITGFLYGIAQGAVIVALISWVLWSLLGCERDMGSGLLGLRRQ